MHVHVCSGASFWGVAVKSWKNQPPQLHCHDYHPISTEAIYRSKGVLSEAIYIQVVYFWNIDSILKSLDYLRPGTFHRTYTCRFMYMYRQLNCIVYMCIKKKINHASHALQLHVRIVKIYTVHVIMKVARATFASSSCAFLTISWRWDSLIFTALWSFPSNASFRWRIRAFRLSRTPRIWKRERERENLQIAKEWLLHAAMLFQIPTSFWCGFYNNTIYYCQTQT